MRRFFISLILFLAGVGVTGFGICKAMPVKAYAATAAVTVQAEESSNVTGDKIAEICMITAGTVSSLAGVAIFVKGNL